MKQILMTFIIVLGGAGFVEAAEYDYLTVSSAFFSAYLSDNGWLQGILVVFLGLFVALICAWLVKRLVLQISSKALGQPNRKIASLFRLPVFSTIFIISLVWGLRLMPLSVTQHSTLISFVQTIGLLVWIYFVIVFVSIVLQKMADVADNYLFIHSRTLTLFDNGAKVVVFGLATYCFFIIWKIDLTAWLASAGIIGIAVGFAAKDTLSNLFSGVFILADVPYRVGDYVVLDGGGGRGKVLQIGLRSTRLLTRDDVEVIIPNSIMGNTTVINQSGGPARHLRVRVKVGVAYGSDVDEVKTVLMKIAQNEPEVPKHPAPRVRFRAFGASSLDFELLCWVGDPELRGRVLDSLNTEIYKQFMARNIEIPYAKQDLYIKEWPQDKSSST